MDQGYYRYPTIAGDRIVFVCEGDLWAVPAGGGEASRLTVTPGQCSTPRLSPDGKWIAFFADDEGHQELYVMPAGGGPPQRMTHFGATMGAVSTWSADSRTIYFTSNRNAWYERETRGFEIARDGQARELGIGHFKSMSVGPKTAFVIGRNSDDCARWKRYRGGTAGDLWIDAHGTGTFERLISLNGNPVWPMWVGGRIYFVDDHEGIGNLYSCLTDGSDLRRHTNETEYYARFPSTDGTRIVYAAGGEIRLLDLENDTVTSVPISAASAAPQTARRFVQAADELEHFAPHPEGTGLAIVARGQPFTMPYWEEAVIHHGQGSQTRYRLTEWMGCANRFVCVSDGAGYERIEMHQTDAPDKPRVITKSDIGRVSDLAVSPCDDCIAVANHRHELLLIDPASGAVRVVDKSNGHRVTDLAFSPDGRWIAYCWWPTNDTSIIRICKVKSGKTHDVTPVLRTDCAPAWDPQGKYLFFISTRDFHPVYDALQFDLSFPQAMRPFVVTLRDDVPSPFLPKPRPIHRDDEHERESEERRKKEVVAIDIDFEGITGRVLGFPVDEGAYDQIVATKNRVLFTRFEVRGLRPAGNNFDEDDEAGTLLAYDFDQMRLATLAQDVSEMRLAADQRTLLYRSHDRLRAIDAQGDLPEDGDDNKPGSEPGRKSGWIDLDRVSVQVQPRAEWAQMYREAWRLQREQFWIEDMSDVDWQHVFERYNRVLPRVRTRLELSDLIWEMQGELGTSHAYEFGGDVRVPPQYSQGFLGADLCWDEREGGYRIDRIYRGDSWNRDTDSPLAEPGTGVREGDVITAIGGKRLTHTFTPEEALVNTAEREVALTVEGKKSTEKRVLVKTLADERALRYRAWVENNRRYVHEKTDGKVGYIHIPDMGPWGFSEFHRGFLSEFDRQGLIVDVRYNRGGHVSPLLLEKLARKRVGYDISRYGPAQPYPPESVGGAMVAMTNQFAGSDGDIFSHCFKLYKLGPLVGKRTWGGVIGINPYHRLVDGTITTQPEFSFWFVDVGWGVENYGTDPDYNIDIAPHDYREGNDPQMMKALELIAQGAKEFHDPRPVITTRPSLKLP
ncbi:MAG: PDZ domain-containing protein [Candidatus Eremiobacteraeota bacterium]|nr:PDZ domain-containing protein [Candidatus Eremiobacteraeota bacterium]